VLNDGRLADNESKTAVAWLKLNLRFMKVFGGTMKVEESSVMRLEHGSCRTRRNAKHSSEFYLRCKISCI
jgi:hypothetical protein